MSFWNQDDIWFYVTLFLSGILIFQAGMWYGGSSSPMPAGEQRQVKPSPEPTTKKPTNTQTGADLSLASVGDHFEGIQTHPDKKALGNPDAPVTVTEYLDVECPFCQRFNRNVVPKIIDNYVRSGDVYYRVRHYPLGMHERAIPAGKALECAADQDAFWPFKYVAMHSQNRQLTDDEFQAMAEQAGVPNLDEFSTCVSSMTHESTVREEKQDGSQRGVSATPTIFINDQKLQGAKPYSEVESVIDQELNG